VNYRYDIALFAANVRIIVSIRILDFAPSTRYLIRKRALIESGLQGIHINVKQTSISTFLLFAATSFSMHSKILLTGVLAASCSFAVANVDQPMNEMIGSARDANVVERRDVSDPMPTKSPKWASTVPPEKVRQILFSQDELVVERDPQISSLHKDMESLASSIKAAPMYTSMTAVLATAVPQTFKDAVQTNPSSIHKQYKSTKPEWYMAMPSDVRSFMESNRKAAKSIYTKDIGPLPTKDKNHGSATATGASAQPTGGDKGSKSSEADSLRVAGAAVCALLGALGIAVMML
jgi:hypothetical protein